MSSLSSTSIISTLEQFKSDAGRLPQRSHYNLDRKAIGVNAQQWFLLNGSNIITDPVGRQSSNGLAERTCCTLIKIARSFITEKQVGREFWYFAVCHAAMMFNQVPS